MTDQHLPDEQPANGTNEPTQIGQFPLQRSAVTHEITATQPATARTAQLAARERVATLIAALGDAEHPLHQQAVGDLVAIGDSAVPALNEALNPRRPWLTSFRAAEALGQIGDGRATSALIEALRHPNSNVRWSAVRALAVIGDARSMLDLRRVAREDRAKTTWGESIAGVAESALDQMRSENVLFRSAELVKTALACVAMLVALVVAWSVVTTLRSDLAAVGRDRVDANALFAPITPTADARATPSARPTSTLSATPAPTPAPAAAQPQAPLKPAATTVITGTALNIANIRAEPTSQRANKIGNLNPGDDLIFLAVSSDNRWFRIQLGERRKANSRIDSADGSGWVIASLVSKPSAELPIETVTLPTAIPATPVPEPTQAPPA